MEENRIITIRKQNLTKASEAFAHLMKNTQHIMNEDAKANPQSYKSLKSNELEEISVKKIKEACYNTPFDPNEVKLVSGQRFPDIIAEKYYGIEVKMTKQNHWKSVGSSIVESTRDSFVEDIYLLFAKMGGEYPEFCCRPYEDVMSDISVTHSPRYFIDMKLQKGETIFDKLNTTYNQFRHSEDSIDRVRKYYREKAVKAKKLEMPWWVTSENADEQRSFNVRLWKSLETEIQNDLLAKCMILFPEVLNPKRSPTKYNQTTLWLCSYSQVVMPNIRDLYSAGGKIVEVDGKKVVSPVPQVFARIVKHADRIKEMLRNPDLEMIQLIADYNPELNDGGDRWQNWLDICLKYADKYGAPLVEWIEKKPEFTYSK